MRDDSLSTDVTVITIVLDMNSMHEIDSMHEMDTCTFLLTLKKEQILTLGGMLDR
jgi:hypothetical protein